MIEIIYITGRNNRLSVVCVDSDDQEHRELKKGLKPKFNITNRITAGLTRIERARGFLEAATLSEAWVREMGRRALILEAHHTTHIEGTRLTLEQAERLLEGKPVPDADPDDARELLNYRRAFDFVSEYLETGGPITEGLIREIHKRLVEGVRGGAGAFPKNKPCGPHRSRRSFRDIRLPSLPWPPVPPDRISQTDGADQRGRGIIPLFPYLCVVYVP